jgi:hypothetical protein
MKNSKKAAVYVVLSFLLLSAGVYFFKTFRNKAETKLEGKWNAAQLVECDETIPIDSRIVNLEFFKNRQYVFNSTLNIHEEGSFSAARGYLYLKNKLVNNQSERVFRINTLNADSLVLEMNSKGKEQWLTFIKDGAPLPEAAAIDTSLLDLKSDSLQ